MSRDERLDAIHELIMQMLNEPAKADPKLAELLNSVTVFDTQPSVPFGEYMATCFRVAQRVASTQRLGQWAFNCLHDFRPDLANQVRGTHLDPFHQDKVLTLFFTFVHENW